jgi:hypothetical protein
MKTREELIAIVVGIRTNGRWEAMDYDSTLTLYPDYFGHLDYKGRREIIDAAMLEKKQAAMRDRQLAKKVQAAKPKSRKTTAGRFKFTRLSRNPDCVIDENGHVIGPSGTELKVRWDTRFKKSARLRPVPRVSINGKDVDLFDLLCEVGYQESPYDKIARWKAKPTPDAPSKYNDEAEAIAEDPESRGCDENGQVVG